MSPVGGRSDAVAEVTITLNGETRALPSGTRLVALLEASGIDVERIAVERNGVVVPRSAHDGIVVAEGDLFEVVQFVGGG